MGIWVDPVFGNQFGSKVLAGSGRSRPTTLASFRMDDNRKIAEMLCWRGVIIWLPETSNSPILQDAAWEKSVVTYSGPPSSGTLIWGVDRR
jgi:hypothetical protein